MVLRVLTLIRGGHGFGVPESTPAGLCVFSDQQPESKFCEKPDPDPKSLFNFGSIAGVCVVISSKNIGKFRLDLWQLESEQESDFEI